MRIAGRIVLTGVVAAFVVVAAAAYSNSQNATPSAATSPAVTGVATTVVLPPSTTAAAPTSRDVLVAYATAAQYERSVFHARHKPKMAAISVDAKKGDLSGLTLNGAKVIAANLTAYPIYEAQFGSSLDKLDPELVWGACASGAYMRHAGLSSTVTDADLMGAMSTHITQQFYTPEHAGVMYGRMRDSFAVGQRSGPGGCAIFWTDQST